LNNTDLEQKFNEKLLEVTKELGYILYDLQYIPGSKTLRVFIMDEKTMTAVIDDCVKVDKALSPFMEENSWIPDEIVLEVSSPGLYRHLKSVQHYQWAKGTPVTLSLRNTLDELFPGEFSKRDGKQKKITAMLLDCDEDGILISYNDDVDLKINYIEIKKANLEPKVEHRP